MLNPRVEQMNSPNSGHPVANQFLIIDDEGITFQSYRSLIARKTYDGKVFLDDVFWDYSRTTGKYRNQFLREGIAETREKIKSGEYILTDLNSWAYQAHQKWCALLCLITGESKMTTQLKGIT